MPRLLWYTYTHMSSYSGTPSRHTDISSSHEEVLADLAGNIRPSACEIEERGYAHVYTDKLINISVSMYACAYMMTSSNGNIFRVTGALCREFTVEFPSQRPVTRSFDVFFVLCLNKRLSKQSWGWWFETPSRPLWRHFNVTEKPPGTPGSL